MQLIIIFAAILCAVSSRIVFADVKSPRDDIDRQPYWKQLVGVLMIPVQIALVVLGFSYFAWWMWIAILLVALPLIGMLVNPSHQNWLLKTDPFISIFAIAATSYAWATHLNWI